MNNKAKTAIIFGATSGLGWAISTLFHQNNWNTLCFGRRIERLMGFRAGVCNERCSKNQIYCGNICNQKHVKEAIEKCLEVFGQIDCVLVTAAVYTTPHKNISNKIRQVFDVNVWGYLNVVSELSNKLKRPSHAVPVFAISSTLSQKAVSGSLPYSFSKSALEKLVQLLPGDISQKLIKCRVYTAPPFNSEMNQTSTKSAHDVAQDLYRMVETEI